MQMFYFSVQTAESRRGKVQFLPAFAICHKCHAFLVITSCFRKYRLWFFIVVQYNNIKYYRLSHDVVTCDVDHDVSTAHC